MTRKMQKIEIRKWKYITEVPYTMFQLVQYLKLD